MRLPARLTHRLSLLALLGLALAALATPAEAAFPGRPGQIVYSYSLQTETASEGGLFSHGPRRSQKPRQLTDNSSDDSPSYSADGRLIAFSGNRDLGLTQGSHIYVMNADGSEVRALTSGLSYDRDPAFSPDGRQVVFDRTLGAGRPHIFVVNIDGTGLRQLTDGPVADYEPTYAPSGKWIAFTSNRDHDVRTDRSDIFSMRPDGSRLRVLIDGPRNESEADISPDGRRIAFVSTREHGPNIFVASSSGRHVRALTHLKRDCFRAACYLSPAWAPDGKHIACLRSGRYSSTLEVMRPDGSNAVEFAHGGTEEEGYGSGVGPPTWGPVPR